MIHHLPSLFLIFLVLLTVSVESTVVLKDRVVTSPEEVESGVTLEFSYNETMSSGKLLSSPGCPKSELGIPWLYFGNASEPKCYLAGSNGPCDRGQVFTPEPGTYYGYCNCLCPLIGNKTGLIGARDEIQYCTGYRDDLQIEIIIFRDYAFVPETKTCHELQSQGFCKQDEWVVVANNKIQCEKRKCDEDKQLYSRDGKVECGEPSAIGAVHFTNSTSPCRNVEFDYVDYFGTCVRKLEYLIDPV